MPRIFIINLSAEDRSMLEDLVSRGANWRARQRAQTLILLDDGIKPAEVAQIIGIHVNTVSTTRRDWFKQGCESLVDAARSGAPNKITPEQISSLAVEASKEPLTAKQLLNKHVEAGGILVHLNTLTAALKASGMVWKRTRHSLKKKRDEVAFRQAQAELVQLRAQATAGEIVLAYVDEAGFSQVHPNRSAWTPRGERHLIEAKRGKRLNVLAAMISTGELISSKLWQTTTADLFVGFLGKLKDHVGRPITVVLDNASIHKAKATKALVRLLEQNGLTLYFLPPYSPELNRIERLWHKMKYTWMAPKCRDAQTLEADIDDILQNFGSKFSFNF